MNKLIIDSQRAIDLIDGEVDDDPDFKLVKSYADGQWRWGVTYEAIIEDNQGKLWGISYRTQTGDNYYNSLEDGDTAHFYPYEAEEVTVTKYRRVTNV